MPFITPIAVFDMREFLPFIRRVFSDKADKFRCVNGSNGLSTTLREYDLIDDTRNQLGEDEESKAFQEAVEANAHQLCNALGYDENYKAKMVSFWVNEMTAGAHHETHSHYGKNFSGCFYADMPENAPGIRFWSAKTRFDKPTVPVVRGNEFNASIWGFTPEEGQLCLWESWIPHDVLAGNFEGIRRSASVDVILKRATR